MPESTPKPGSKPPQDGAPWGPYDLYRWRDPFTEQAKTTGKAATQGLVVVTCSTPEAQNSDYYNEPAATHVQS